VTDTSITVHADDDVMDFSIGRKSIKFKVDDDYFEAVPDIAAELAMEYASQLEQLIQPEEVSLDSQKEVVYSTLRLVLFPESADRFIARLRDQETPIGQQRFTKITQWLLEQYGMRPTEQDSASSTGSESQDAGTN
jgi:hypothetical protein